MMQESKQQEQPLPPQQAMVHIEADSAHLQEDRVREVDAQHLFGSECWTLSANTKSRLNSFHNRCVRQMCRLTTWQPWKLRIHQHTMESRLNIKCVDSYLARRRLGWPGHLVRMDFEKRLPRKLLSGRMGSKRPRGRPPNGFAHALMTEICNACLNMTEIGNACYQVHGQFSLISSKRSTAFHARAFAWFRTVETSGLVSSTLLE